MIRSERMFALVSGCSLLCWRDFFQLVLYGNLFAFELLLNNTVTIEHLNNLTFLIIGFFTVRLIAYGFGYTQGQIGGGAVSRQIRLYLGDKFKRIPLSRFHQGQIGQYVNTMTSDVSNYEQILTHRTGNLVKNISLSVMLILFVCFLICLPA